MNYFFLSLLVLLCALHSARGDIWKCSPKKSVYVYNQYSSPNNTYLAPNQDCTYKITFNSTAFLYFDLSAHNSTKGDTFTVLDTFGNIFERTTDFRMFTALPPPSITVIVTTGPHSNITSNLMMVARKFSPFNVNTVPIKTSPSIPPTMMNLLSPNTSYVIESKSRVALSLVHSSRDRDPSRLMAVYVYEGTGPTATLIGSLYSALSNPIISKGNVMTLYAAMETQDSYVIFNDYSNVQSFSEYTTGWTDLADSTATTYSMDASNGPAALTIGRTANIRDATYLTNATFSDSTATLTVMSGAPTSLKNYQLVTYTAGTIASYLPQQFPLQLTTFVLSKGTASLVFTGTYLESNFAFARLNRRGFIMTKEYPAPSPSHQQFIVANDLISGGICDFDIKLLHFDKTKNANNNLVFTVDGSKNFSWPLSKAGNQTLTLTGNSLKVDLSSYNPSASGTMLSFEINEATTVTTTPKSTTGFRCGFALLIAQLLRVF